MERRIELAASVKNEKIKALIVTMERKMELLAASVLNQKTETNWEVAIQRGQTDIVEADIEKQKYYGEYNNECTAVREAEKADYVAATATMIANT